MEDSSPGRWPAARSGPGTDRYVWSRTEAQVGKRRFERPEMDVWPIFPLKGKLRKERTQMRLRKRWRPGARSDMAQLCLQPQMGLCESFSHRGYGGRWFMQ